MSRKNRKPAAAKAAGPIEARITEQETKLRENERRAYLQMLESQNLLIQTFIDPRDEQYDPETGERWELLGGEGRRSGALDLLFDIGTLDWIRDRMRELDTYNEYAINGYENRVSYTIGTGFTYTAASADKEQADRPSVKEMVKRTQAVVDEFIDDNDWHQREQESLHYADRDGEVFHRLFADGRKRKTIVRNVDPYLVRPPEKRVLIDGVDVWSFGILTEAKDVETVKAYYIDGEEVPERKVLHIKLNVDRNVKRGLSTFYPIWKNLNRAETIQKNMSKLAAIQSAFAVIRKHKVGTQAQIAAFADEQTDYTVQNQTTGREDKYRKYKGGKVLDIPMGMEYDFPAVSVKAAELVEVKQSDLRSAAARLVMPEWMFTSKADDNFANTFVTQGPAVKMFQRLQGTISASFSELMWRVIKNAVLFGRLSPEVLQFITLQVEPPSIITRKPLEEAQSNQILYQNRIISRQTWASRADLDYREEQINMQAEDELGDIDADDMADEDDAATPPEQGGAGSDQAVRTEVSGNEPELRTNDAE